MSEDLGDARLALSTDQSELDRGLDAGEAKTRSFLDRVGTATKTTYKIVAGAIATGLAAATLQGAKLNQVLNDLQAETGATGDDWAAMEAVVRRENGRTTESIEDIGAATKAMRQDLGLTGAEIDKYADRIFDAGLATHMGSVAITKATDDIGDAYELDIDRALGSIDQLIAGQEKWGGDLQARIAALPGLAKGIKGLGGTVDDAIALLNVASARGLDYAEVQKAVNAAVGKFKVPPDLKDIIGLQDLHKSKTQLAREEVEKIEAALKDFVAPNELRELIAQLDGIEDPTLRAAAAEKIYNEQVAALKTDPIARYLDILGEIPDAQARTQRAIELFGPKAGPIWAELAAKVHEAGGSLSSFSVSQEEAGNKATELARKIGAGPIRFLKLLGEQLGALLADAGSNPLVSGIASLGTILGGFAPNLSGKVANGLIGILKSAWGKVAASSVVSAAVAFAADKYATVYLKALFAQDALGAVLGRAWAATGGRMVAAAQVEGSLAGRAFAVAAAAAIVAAPIAILYVAIEVADDVRKSKGTFADQIDRVVQEGSLEALKNAKAAIEKQIESQKIFGVIPFEFAGEVDAMKGQLDRINAAIAAKTAAGGTEAGSAFGDSMAAALNDSIPAAGEVGENAGDAMVAAWKARMAGQTPLIRRVLMGPITAAGAAAAIEARRQGRLQGEEIAAGIRSAREDVDQAWATFLDALKNVETPGRRAARLIGRLTSKELAKGLDDNREEVRLEAEAVLQETVDELGKIVEDGGHIGKKGMQALRDGMHSKNPQIKAAATAIYNTIHNHLPDKNDGKRWGGAIGQGIYNGLKAWGAAIGAVVGSIAAMMADFWRTGSPSKRGPLSTLGGPEGWGRRIGFGLAGGIGQSIGAVQAALGGAVSVPQFPALTPRLALPTGAGFDRGRDPFGGPTRATLGTSKTYIQNVKLEGTPRARDPLGVARQLTRLARTGELEKAWERESD